MGHHHPRADDDVTEISQRGDCDCYSSPQGRTHAAHGRCLSDKLAFAAGWDRVEARRPLHAPHPLIPASPLPSLRAATSHSRATACRRIVVTLTSRAMSLAVSTMRELGVEPRPTKGPKSPVSPVSIFASFDEIVPMKPLPDPKPDLMTAKETEKTNDPHRQEESEQGDSLDEALAEAELLAFTPVQEAGSVAFQPLKGVSALP